MCLPAHFNTHFNTVCHCCCRGLNLDGAAAARGVLAQAAAAGGRVVAFFCESIISCGGQVCVL